MEFHQYRTILRTLVDHEVDFIIVGGVAAVLCGAPLNTFDIDIVHARDAANVTRALSALRELGAYYRHHPKRIAPDESHLASPGHQLLMTEHAALDVLGTIGRGLGYADLLPHSSVREVAPGLRVRVLDLEMLITVKEQTAAEKDLAALPVLRATLAEIRRSQASAKPE